MTVISECERIPRMNAIMTTTSRLRFAVTVAATLLLGLGIAVEGFPRKLLMNARNDSVVPDGLIARQTTASLRDTGRKNKLFRVVPGDQMQTMKGKRNNA